MPDPRPKAWYGSLLPAYVQPPDEGNSQGRANASRKRHVPYPLALLDADQRLLVRVENPDEHRGIAFGDGGPFLNRLPLDGLRARRFVSPTRRSAVQKRRFNLRAPAKLDMIVKIVC